MTTPSVHNMTGLSPSGAMAKGSSAIIFTPRRGGGVIPQSLVVPTIQTVKIGGVDYPYIPEIKPVRPTALEPYFKDPTTNNFVTTKQLKEKFKQDKEAIKQKIRAIFVKLQVPEERRDYAIKATIKNMPSYSYYQNLLNSQPNATNTSQDVSNALNSPPSPGPSGSSSSSSSSASNLTPLITK